MVLTGHIFILILLPIIGHLRRTLYLYCFITLCMTHIVNYISMLGDVYSLNNVIEICWPMPVSFLLAWHINRIYWRQKIS